MADDLYHASRSDSKRKFDDHGGAASPSLSASASFPRTASLSTPIISPPSVAAAAPSYNSVPPPLDGIELAKRRAQEIAARIFSDAEAKRPRVDSGSGADDSSSRSFGIPDHQSLKPIGQTIGSQIGAATSAFPSVGFPGSSKRIYIPNGRVGVIIGKSGETIKYLQMQSGARIQVTRDMDADPNSQTRPVELIGTPEQISKAEQLIYDVISEADAGGSGTVTARNSTDVPAGSEHFSMRVPNNKVGLIIGKGGETIRSMQATSGARIQVIPLHLPPGDTSAERTVHIDGTKEQIESAKLLVNDVISENRVRNPATTGGYRPPRPPTSWVPSGAPPMQQPSYGYMQPGAYPGPPPQYMMSQLPYGGYPTASSGWDQSTHTAAQSIQGTGYDYYAQLQQQQSVVGSSAPSDGTGYSYNQMPSGYNGEASYGESAYPQSAVGNEQSSAHSVDYTQAGSQTAYAQPMYNLHASYTQHGYADAAVSSQDGSAPKYVVEGSTQQTPLSGHAPTAQQPQGLIPQQPTTAAQPGYVQSQGQKPPQSPAYGQGLQPLSSQAGYAQPMQVYGQPSQGYSQSSTATTGYPQDPQRVSPGYGVSHPGYGQQQQQFYGGTAESQTTGYVQQQQQQQQHPYSTGSYDSPAAAPASTNGVAKSSPQS